jgi:phage tail sheath gpL-like
MNLETTVQRQVDLNYRLNDFTIQLRVVVDKIAGKELETGENVLKPEFISNGIIDELQYLQEENKETLQEAERLLRRLVEATWQPEQAVGGTLVSNS